MVYQMIRIVVVCTEFVLVLHLLSLLKIGRVVGFYALFLGMPSFETSLLFEPVVHLLLMLSLCSDQE